MFGDNLCNSLFPPPRLTRPLLNRIGWARPSTWSVFEPRLTIMNINITGERHLDDPKPAPD